VFRRAGVILLATLLVAGCGHGPRLPHAPFTPPLARSAGSVRETFRAADAPGATGLHHYEYVFPDRAIVAYDIDRGHRLAARWSVPDAHALRGVAVSPRTRRLYLSVGGNGGASGTGAIIAYDLLRNRVLWKRDFPTGTDSPALTADGNTLLVPVGERSLDDVWWVVDARSGRVTGEIHAGPGPHNTIVTLDGRHAYLGPRNSRFLYVASTRTLRIVRRIGPLLPGVRPFTIDGGERFAYTTATGVLGFQVSSIRSGRVLFTMPIRGFRGGRSLGTPSHGISLTPDGRELDVIDVPNGYVHAFDVTGLPTTPPRRVADIRLAHPLTGKESPCGGDCGRAGWLQATLDGRYLYVGDSGDVVDLHTHRVAAFLPALRNSRYLLELDWRGAMPLRTSTRSDIGH
jgi:DNA-binding beta-propeller fold protein YncE